MAWFSESKRSWLESLTINVLKNGPIPEHIAFIMDGNRRYAKKIGLRKVDGHALGFDKLSQTLEWCLDLGITEVTLYTFSIENFKRSREEVDCLMELARDKFKKLLNEKHKLDDYGVHIRVLGDLELLPVDIQMLIAEAVLYTKDNNKTFLNVCFAYTSTNEMTNAVKDIASSVVNNELEIEDVTENLFDRSLYSAESPPPDVLVRTSGEVRLSDFLLWQSSFSLLSFMKVLWPEFSIWHLFLAVLFYQHSYTSLKEIEKKTDDISDLFSKSQKLSLLESTDRQNKFIENLHAKRSAKLEDMLAGRTIQKLVPSETNDQLP